MMNIFKIIKAKLRNKNKITDKWYHDRMKICNQCPLNSMNIESKAGLKYWFWKILNIGKTFCTKCGCELEAKTSEEMEKCPKGKWNQITE